MKKLQHTADMAIDGIMDNKLMELEYFLNSVINNYPPLPKATNIEERLDRAAVYGNMLADYRAKVHLKIKELSLDMRIHEVKDDIQRVANDCLRNYNSRQVSLQ